MVAADPDSVTEQLFNVDQEVEIKEELSDKAIMAAIKAPKSDECSDSLNTTGKDLVSVTPVATATMVSEALQMTRFFLGQRQPTECTSCCPAFV